MALTNFERLIQLADEIFAVKSDPSQLDINPAVRKRLLQIHPSTMLEHSDENGPVAWVLLIPTTLELMHKFLAKEISERELFEMTPLNINYEAVYLCSALVLKEYRRKGITKNLVLTGIGKIRKKQLLKAAFAWTFSTAGGVAAENIARLANLQFFRREK